MKRRWFQNIGVMMIASLFLVAPVKVQAEGEQVKKGAPPIEQKLISEGNFAVKLANALAITKNDDVVEAESRLGDLGIIPHNGWIADYPMAPDIVLELQNSLGVAADAKKIPLSRIEALQRMRDIQAGVGLSIHASPAMSAPTPTAESCENYPNPVAINERYIGMGPPVITYYCPPPEFYYLYSWVPSAFMWDDFWYPGYYILQDFHRIDHDGDRVVVISNHFRDFKSNRTFRVDPVERFNGKTFSGIGVGRGNEFIPTGIQKSEQTIFNGPRAEKSSSGEAVRLPEWTPPFSGGEAGRFAPSGGGGGEGRGGGESRGGGEGGRGGRER